MPVQQAFKRYVEVGRVVLIADGPSAGKLAVIVEIIDHNRAMIDGPTTGVPRQAFPYRHLVLTPLLVANLTRGARSATVKKLFEKENVAAKWESSGWAQKRKAVERRKATSDFERFEIMLLKKQRRRVVGKEIAKAKKASA